jgi:hypothetical protein
MKTMLLVVCVMCVCPWAALAGQVASGEEAAATWEALPRMPRARGEAVITGMGVDSGGTLWVMTNTAPNIWSEPIRKLFWWDGTKWEAAKDADEAEGEFFHSLFGGGKRGLYAVHWRRGPDGEKAGPARICELVGGKVRLVTEFAQKPWLEAPVVIGAALPPSGLYVANDGRLFAYGDSFLEAYLDGKWRHLAHLREGVVVSFVEQGKLVHVVYDKFLCTVSPDGTAVTRGLQGLASDELGSAERAVLWGDDKLLVLTPPRPEPVNLRAYELESGKPIDLKDVQTALKRKVVIDAFGVPDGSVWLCAVDAIFGRILVVSEDNAGSLRVLSPDGDLFELEELRTVNWRSKWSRFCPGSILSASDGTFWLAAVGGELIAYKDGAFTRHGRDDGLPDPIHFLAEASDGTIYAASNEAVWVFSSQTD